MPPPAPDSPYHPANPMNIALDELSKANQTLPQSTAQAVELIVKAAEQIVPSAPPESKSAAPSGDSRLGDCEPSDNVRDRLLARVRGIGAAPAKINDDEPFDQWVFSKGQSLAAPADSLAASPVPRADTPQPPKPKPVNPPTPPAPKDDPKSWSEWIENESLASPPERKWDDLLE